MRDKLLEGVGNEDLRDMIIPKDVDHESKELIEDIIKNLQTNESLSNKLIKAGISTLERLYNIAVITKVNKKTGRVEIVEWFKERRKLSRKNKKSFKDIIIL